MTFSATGIVQSVEARTNGDDGLVITCGIDSPAPPYEDSPIITGTIRLEVRQGFGLQIPQEGDRLTVNGWFSYDDGSRASVPAALPEDTRAGSDTPV